MLLIRFGFLNIDCYIRMHLLTIFCTKTTTMYSVHPLNIDCYIRMPLLTIFCTKTTTTMYSVHPWILNIDSNIRLYLLTISVQRLLLCAVYSVHPWILNIDCNIRMHLLTIFCTKTTTMYSVQCTTLDSEY